MELDFAHDKIVWIIWEFALEFSKKTMQTIVLGGFPWLH